MTRLQMLNIATFEANIDLEEETTAYVIFSVIYIRITLSDSSTHIALYNGAFIGWPSREFLCNMVKYCAQILRIFLLINILMH